MHQTTQAGHPNDAYWLAMVHLHAAQYPRAVTLLEPFTEDPLCRYLLAKCWLKMERPGDAMELLGYEDTWPHESAEGNASVMKLEASVHALRGHIYAQLENLERAIHCYKAALLADVKCYEAFEALIVHRALSPKEGIREAPISCLLFARQYPPQHI
jgi:anaphase-promoting complex subunit 6